MLESVLNIVFSPVVRLDPWMSILTISMIISIILTFVNKKVMNSTNANEVKQKMEKARAGMLEAQKNNDKESVDKQMKKMMEMNSEYLQSMIKPLSISLAISMLLVILFFPWMRTLYEGKTIVTIPEGIPFIGGKVLNWLWWYIICSIITTLLLKILRLS